MEKALLFRASILLLFIASIVSAGWWDPSFAYRKQVTISNPGPDYLDHVLELKFDSATPISEGKMASDCSDLRFTLLNVTDGTETELNYFLYADVARFGSFADKCADGNHQAGVHLRLPEITANSVTTVYMYYGTVGLVSTQSDYKKVYHLWDNFEGNTINQSIWALGCIENIYCNVQNNKLNLYPGPLGTVEVELNGSIYPPIWLQDNKKFYYLRSSIFVYNWFHGFMINSTAGFIFQDTVNNLYEYIIYSPTYSYISTTPAIYQSSGTPTRFSMIRHTEDYIGIANFSVGNWESTPLVITESAEEFGIIRCGDTITKDAVLTSDLNCAGNGIIIGANGITLDCNGYKITGSNILDTYGVYSNQSNTTIRNCNISDFDIGVFFKSNSYGKIQNTSAKSNTALGLGILLYIGATNNQIIDSKGTSPRAGIAFYSSASNNQIINSIGTSTIGDGIVLVTSSNNNTFINSIGISNSGNGIYLHTSSDNTFIYSAGTSVLGYGVNLFSSTYNTISNGLISGKGALFFTRSSGYNTIANNTINGNTGTWAVSLQTGSGIQLTGNQLINNTILNATNLVYLDLSAFSNTFYWNNFTDPSTTYIVDDNGGNFYNATTSFGIIEGNIYADVMNGSVQIYGTQTSNGFPSLYIGKNGTDYPYNITNSAKFSCNFNGCADYAPLTFALQSHNISCGDSITTDTVLTSDLYCPGNGIIIGANGITLDCNGHLIASPEGGSGSGIVSQNKNNLTIKNCIIKNFEGAINSSGIYLDSVLYSDLTNNTVQENYWGMALVNSSFNILENNLAKGSVATSFYVTDGSNYNKLKRNKVIDSATAMGFYVYANSTDNQLIENEVANSGAGFWIRDLSTIYLIKNNVHETTHSGFVFTGVNKSILDSNIARNNAEEGFRLTYSSFNQIISNIAYGNGQGYSLQSAYFNNLTNNTVNSNSIGIRLSSSSNNTIYNNFFNNSINAIDYEVNFWNTTKTFRTNIIGGSYIAGNFWADYNGTDIDGDGIGDMNLPYTSNGNISNGGDFAPLTYSSPSQPIYTTFIYDEFSEAELNITKWDVSAGVDGFPPISEYYQDALNQNYHTAQLNPMDGRVRATIAAFRFSDGNSLDYDINLHSGSGNYLSRLIINDLPLDVNPALCPYCGAIGYWGQPMSGGDAPGLYHVRIDFKNSNTSVRIYRPDNTFTSYTVPNFSAPFKYAFETTTGGGSLTHIDYDNFIINQNCGDMNHDFTMNVMDVVGLIDYVFRGAPAPSPAWIADIDGNGEPNVIDIVKLIDYVFRGGPVPTCSLPVNTTSSIATIGLGAVSGTLTEKTIPVTINSIENVAGATFLLSYDSTKMRILDITKSPSTAGLTLIRNGNSFGFIDASGNNQIAPGSGPIAYVKVAPGKLGFDTSSLKITKAVVANPDGKAISVKITPQNTGPIKPKLLSVEVA